MASLIYNKSITNIYHKKEGCQNNETDYDIRYMTLSDIKKLDFP